jgi:hypothetical protein
MSVMTVVEFPTPREIAVSAMRRRADRARIRRAMWVALMLLSMTAGIQVGIANLQVQYNAAAHQSVPAAESRIASK